MLGPVGPPAPGSHNVHGPRAGGMLKILRKYSKWLLIVFGALLKSSSNSAKALSIPRLPLWMAPEYAGKMSCWLSGSKPFCVSDCLAR